MSSIISVHLSAVTLQPCGLRICITALDSGSKKHAGSRNNRLGHFTVITPPKFEAFP